jgi:hypothetical protein
MQYLEATMNKLKLILVLIKNNWKVIILVTWMAYITLILISIKKDTNKLTWDAMIIKSELQ